MKAIFIKRFWIAEILALGLVAFFVASGVGEMLVDRIEAQLGSQLAAPARPANTAPRTGRRQTRRAVDGTPILRRNIFDSINPGAMVLNRTPVPEYSDVNVRVNPNNADLEELYALTWGNPKIADMELMLIIEPFFLSIIPGNTVFIREKIL